MPKKGGKRKKTKTHAKGIPEGATILQTAGGSNEANEVLAEKSLNVPRTIVAKASKVSTYVAELIRDIRKLMAPYTAANLRERR